MPNAPENAPRPDMLAQPRRPATPAPAQPPGPAPSGPKAEAVAAPAQPPGPATAPPPSGPKAGAARIRAGDLASLPPEAFLAVSTAAAAPSAPAGARPPRLPDPAQQPPAPRPGKELVKGQAYWIVDPEDLDRPRRGKIVRLTRTPGKHVGVELDGPVGPHLVHDCDGAGTRGNCLYCRVDQVLTDDEYKAYAVRHQGAAAPPRPLEDLERLTIDVGQDGVTRLQ